MPKKQADTEITIIPVEQIGQRIYLIRGEKVMFDFDLADLYQVPTKAFNQGVKRNINRFPADFMFQLTKEELENWRSQIVTSNPAARKGLRRPPYVFTEHGVAMLSSVLNSKRAVQMNILIIRAFVKLRELLATNKDLAARVAQLEANQDQHASVINILAQEIENLKQPPPEPPRNPIGFIVPHDDAADEQWSVSETSKSPDVP